MDYTVHGILQARIPEWIVMSFSRGSSQSRDWTQVSSTAGRFFTSWTTAAARSLQSCPTLRDPIDRSPSGSPVPGILQARALEWVAISFSNAWKWKVKVKSLRRVRLLATPWTAAHQAPPSMGFSRQEHWSGLPLPSPSWTTREAQNLKVKVTKLCPTLETPWTVACQAPLPVGFFSWNTGMGYHFLLQGIFLMQESNPRLLHFRQILYQLSYEGSPWTIQSVAFSRPEYWSGQPFPSPGDLPNPRIEPRSPALQWILF